VIVVVDFRFGEEQEKEKEKKIRYGWLIVIYYEP